MQVRVFPPNQRAVEFAASKGDCSQSYAVNEILKKARQMGILVEPPSSFRYSPKYGSAKKKSKS